ncbi:MAG: hypothetical protein LBB88_00520 [Planctomycetaceae bacterium]|jgi:hypothetical protein|nr:hypothetical protein [Planctomycetaceae bacterium]
MFIIFEPIIQILIYIVILMIGTLVSLYLLGLFRANSLQHEHNVDNTLNYFQELKDKGKLSDAEFRIIKERFKELIKTKDEKKPNAKTLLHYKDAISLLLDFTDPAASQDTQIAGRNECNNKNGQAEYSETETIREKDHDKD